MTHTVAWCGVTLATCALHAWWSKVQEVDWSLSRAESASLGTGNFGGMREETALGTRFQAGFGLQKKQVDMKNLLQSASPGAAGGTACS